MHLLLLLLAASPAEDLYPQLLPVYQQLHAHPELSGKEVKTSALLAEKLKKLGYELSPRFGGQGFFAVKKHGDGPTLLIRTEMDALPVEEKTGLPFASTVKVDEGGQSVGVMHACGHDLHMTAWLGAATALARDNSWKGTLIFLAQPAEEMGDGAVAMIKDGVLQKLPKPDFAIAFHNHGNLQSGKVGIVKGYALAAVDTVDVTFFGKGGHGAYPHTTVDPIAMASKAVLSWQTLVSRENNPLDPAVVTVGTFHAGTRSNIIPDEAKLSLTVRSYAPQVRQKLLQGITRIANAEAESAGAPKPPKVDVSAGPQAVFNDVELTTRLEQTLKLSLGNDRVVESEKVMGAEDFGEFGVAGRFPSVMLWLGSVEPKKYDELHAKGQLPPSLHSATYAPDFERGFKTAVDSYVAIVHELLR